MVEQCEREEGKGLSVFVSPKHCIAFQCWLKVESQNVGRGFRDHPV